MTAEQEAHANIIAEEIKVLSADVIQEIAELLSTTPDAKLFGDTEFVVRSLVMKIIGRSFTAHLHQKKTATTAPASFAPNVSDRLSSRVTASEIPSVSAVKSAVSVRTTTAVPAEKAAVRGIKKSA